MSGKVLENKLVTVTTGEDYYCYDWLIKVSCNCDDCSYNICSPSFDAISSQSWYLSLCISYAKPMTLEMKGQSIDFCSLKLGVRNKENAICYRTKYYVSKYSDNKFEFIYPHSIRNCNYWYEGVLKLVAEIFKPVNVIPFHSEKVLKSLLQSEKFSDVTLVVGKREFRAHKAVLAAQSPVFLAMFEHDMKEKAENKVIIEDIGDEIMQFLLNYMYTGSVEKEELKETAIDVLVAADKYALEDLVKICEETLIQGLNKDNVFKVLQTADSHKLDSLKKAAINFIADETEVLQSIEMNNLMINSTDLFEEIIQAIALTTFEKLTNLKKFIMIEKNSLSLST